MNTLYYFYFPIDAGSIIYGDRAYNAYAIEDELGRSNISLNPFIKKIKRKYDSFVDDRIKLIRKCIESVFSVINQMISSAYPCCHRSKF